MSYSKKQLFQAAFNAVVFYTLISTANATGCLRRKYTADSVVCVCNSTYCDDLPVIQQTPAGTYTTYTSTLSGERFANATGSFSPSVSNAHIDATVTISPTGDRQTIFGFGGAMTDAAGLNIKTLSPQSQDRLLTSYFAPNGAQYRIIRVPMAGCDFSTHVYSYDETPNDFELKNFNLTKEDLDIKIPLILKAQKISLVDQPMMVFASPWSAPAWMKTNNKEYGFGTLKGQAGDEYHKAWANYFVKFVQAYEAENVSSFSKRKRPEFCSLSSKVTIWGLTAQNEPIDGYVPQFSFNAMGFTPGSQRDFIAKDLGPALTAAGLRRIKLMIMDDQRFLLPNWPNKVLADRNAAQYVDGIGVHWYFDFVTPVSKLEKTHELHPDKFILATEACHGTLPGEAKISLGDWGRAESYATDIIEDLQNWVCGWTDWNLALDTRGGPNWANNFVDSPIIINSTNDEFLKQPMFYALSHFSKFILPQSRIIKSNLSLKPDGFSKWSVESSNGLSILASQRPDTAITLIVLNEAERDFSVKFVDGRLKRGQFVQFVPARSIQSYIWW